MALALAVVAAGIGTALVVTGGSDSGSTDLGALSDEGGGEASTVPETTTTEASRSGTATSSAPPPRPSGATAGSVVAGSYIQAGSFRTVAGAESEQRRLESVGIDTTVIDSDQAQEFYPGFQVLIAGPFSGGAGHEPLRLLHRNGAPSAYIRPLSPALEIPGPEAIAGEWGGTLEVLGSGRPKLDGPTRATLSADPDGLHARLTLPELHCDLDLALSSASAVTLDFSADRDCFGGDLWAARPEAESVALTLLPAGSETIVTGRLQAE